MKKILILSDTHSYFDAGIEKYAVGHDEIWHAGDWGNIDIYDKLSQFALVKGVFGNIDSMELHVICPVVQEFTCEEVRVYMTHSAGYPGRYKNEVQTRLRQTSPNLVICGHSHILKVMYDRKLKHLHINPGAIGLSGFHKVRTMVSMEIHGPDMRNLNVIEFER